MSFVGRVSLVFGRVLVTCCGGKPIFVFLGGGERERKREKRRKSKKKDKDNKDKKN